MNYLFPEIHTIDDVLPAISGKDEFIVAKKNGYTVINYIVTKNDTFDMNEFGPMRRECRGLIFDSETKKIISRPFHKFFNVGEREETLLNSLDFSQEHTYALKLDGSMVRPFYLNGSIRWGTKMGITDTSMRAEVFVAKNPQYNKMAKLFLDSGLTPIFEWCSRSDKIVIDYPEDQLVLLAIRANTTGMYMPRVSIERIAYNSDIPLVQEICSNQFDADVVMEYVRTHQEIEGLVIDFGQHRVKIKAEKYVRIHKIKDRIRTDRHILDLILQNELDDVIPELDSADVQLVKTYETVFWKEYNEKLSSLESFSDNVIQKANGDRKYLAVELLKDVDSITKQCIFKKLDGIPIRDFLMKKLEQSVSNTQKYEEMRKWLTCGL